MANFCNNISQDIIDQILPCLPVKSLMRFKCVCKSWASLFTGPQFTRKHFERASLQNPDQTISAKLLISVPCGFKSLDLEKSFDDEAALIRLPLPPYAACFIRVKILGSCHGLICFGVGNLCCSHFFLWNPATGESKMLPDCNVIMMELGLECYGFGYDPSSDDYKLLLKIEGQIVIFSLAKYSWRMLPEARWPAIGYGCYQRGVYSNGDLHWEVHLGNIFIFDLKTEKFHLRPRPDSTVVGHRHKLFGVQGIPYCIKEITNSYVQWIKTYYSTGSWTERIISPSSVYDTRPHFLMQFLCFSEGNALVTENGEDIIKLDAEGGVVENIRICSSPSQRKARYPHFCDAITYVESLVSPHRSNLSEGML